MLRCGCAQILKKCGRFTATWDSPGVFVKPTRDNLEVQNKEHRRWFNGYYIPLLMNDEEKLSLQLLQEMPSPLTEKYPYVYLYEWNVRSQSFSGKGDFVFASGHGDFAVVEVKYFTEMTGPRATKRRKKVREQAFQYADSFARTARLAGVHIRSLQCFTYTNDVPRGRLKLLHTYKSVQDVEEE